MVNLFRFSRTILVLFLLAVSTLLPEFAFGQRPVAHWSPHVAVQGQGHISEVTVNDMVVLRFRQKRGGLLPQERAERAVDHIKEALASGLGAGAVRVDDSYPSEPQLRIAGQPLLTAIAPDIPKVKSRRRRRRLLAAARETAYAEVAHAAVLLKQALSLPGLKLSESGKVIPLAETRTIRLHGAAHGALHITTLKGNSSVVRWQVDPTGNAITFSGLKPGRETVFIEREGAVATFYTAVKPYAGQVESPRSVTVTGSMAPASLIERLVRVAALTCVTLTPGASKRITADALGVSPVPVGQTGLVEVPVRLWGPDMLPVERKVFVPVVNRRLPIVPTTSLLYSNNPERIMGPGNLFIGRLPDDTQMTRLLYHHQNDTRGLLHFSAELINDSDTPVQVQVVGGDAGPERDTVWVGYRAAADYIQASENGTGVVVEVPARSYVALSSLRLPPGQTVSGLMHLRTLSGPAPLIRIIAEPATLITHPVYLPLPLDEKRRGACTPANFSEHVYPNPSKKLEAEYNVGGAWTFIKYGRFGISASTSPQTVLQGNYGVFYDITVNLQNPTENSARVRLVFEPSAGMAGGIFRIGDRKVEIPQSDMPKETTLATYTLAPGESRKVTIRTLPLSGSNYPASIIVRP
jgi:hypothetical protein